MLEEQRLSALIRTAVDRRSDRAVPSLQVLSTRGLVDAALLARLRRREAGPAPSALFDGREFAGLRPHEVALRLSWPLGRRMKRFGQIDFPRFYLGLAAIHGPLHGQQPDHPLHAREEMIRQTVPDRAGLREWLRDMATTLAVLAGAGQAVGSFVAQVVDGAVPTLRTASIRRSAGAAWFRQGLGEEFADPVQALVELARREAANDRMWVDEVLVRAFLDDLRAEYGSSWHLFAHDTGCLVLVENADTADFQAFLDLLPPPDSALPLVVVAASDVRYAADGVAANQLHVQPLNVASLAEWERHSDRPGWSRRYPVRFGTTDPPTPMSGPNTAHVRELAEQVEPPWHGPAARQAIAFAHRLTAGHSPTFARVVALLRQNDQTAVDARTVLTQPLNEPGGPSLDDVVLDVVLGDRPVELRPALSRLAIARDLSDASITPILQTERESMAHQVLEFRATDMWTSSAPPTLHPLARRAIAHRLARPGGVGNVVWAVAHNQLRLAAVERDDLTTARYHQLALGQVADVAHELSIEFDPVTSREWFAQLVTIAEAPLAHPQTGMNSVDHFAKLTGSDDHSELVVTTRLVAALQLHTDPLGDPTHQLCQTVAEELRHLAHHHAAGGMVFLLERADEYAACWNRWHRGGN
ncbi:MAG: hypothetical protein M3332_00910 [Actinomycetota bacterium]|nr:hypothetical protein [Actinomycetota bacterium]